MKVSAEQKPFSFVVDSKEFDTAISKIVAVVSSKGATTVKGFLVVAQKTTLSLVGYNPDTYVTIKLRSGVPEGVGCFAFNHQTMQGLIKNRGEMAFSYVGHDINFKSTKGKYSGSVPAEQFTDEQAGVINAALSDDKDAKHDALLPGNVLTVLKEGVNLTAVKDVFTDEALLSYMILSEKGILSVSSFDKHHFGLYRAEVESKGLTFKVALPSSHFNMIDRMAEAEDVKFFVRAESLKIVGDSFTMILPSTQTDEGNYTVISGYLKELEKPTFTCDVDTAKLSNVVANLSTLRVVNSIFDLSHKQDSALLNIKFSTSNGSASDAFKVQNIKSSGMKAKIDPLIVRDIINLLKGHKEAELQIVPNRVVRFNCTTEHGKVALVGSLAD